MAGRAHDTCIFHLFFQVSSLIIGLNTDDKSNYKKGAYEDISFSAMTAIFIEAYMTRWRN